MARDHTAALNQQFVEGLARLARDIKESEDAASKRYRLATDGLISISLSATAGILAWVLRVGALFASAIAYTPLWSSIDPVRMVTGKSDDESADEGNEAEEIISEKQV